MRTPIAMRTSYGRLALLGAGAPAEAPSCESDVDEPDVSRSETPPRSVLGESVLEPVIILGGAARRSAEEPPRHRRGRSQGNADDLARRMVVVADRAGPAAAARPLADRRTDLRLGRERQLVRARDGLDDDVVLLDAGGEQLALATLDEVVDDGVVPARAQDADAEAGAVGREGGGERVGGGSHLES